MTVKPIKFAALVLAGGQSRRMGTNKALLQAYPGGPTLIESVIEKVREAGADEVRIVTNEREPYVFLDIPIIEDAIKDVGPISGILGGLRASSWEQNLVVACDMPNINPLVIRHMATLTGNHDVVVPRWVDSAGGIHVEPLHAIYSRASLPRLEACIAADAFALHLCFHSLHVRFVDEEELAPYGNPAASFRNMNRPEDWASFTNQ